MIFRCFIHQIGIKPDLCAIFILSHYSYPAKWGGVVDNKPMAAGLAEFGLDVMHKMKTVISNDYPMEVSATRTIKSKLRLIYIHASIKDVC